MCDELSAFIDRCEPLIREGHFDELDQVLRTYEPLMIQCIPCRQQGAFYRAVWLGMARRDYAISRVLLSALTDSAQIAPTLRARAMNFAAMLADFQDRYGESIRLYQCAADICASVGDLNGQARAALNQAIVYNNRLHDPRQALTLLTQAEEWLKQAGNPREMVRVLNERGQCWLYLKNWTKAREALRASHVLCVQQESAYLGAICETNLGSLERLQGHWVEAEAYYAPLPAIFQAEDTRNPLLQAEVLFYLNEVALAQGRFDWASAYLDQVMNLATANASPHFSALAQLGRARVAGQRGNREQALDLYGQAAREVEQIRSAQGGQDVRLDFQAQWNALYREAAAYALQLDQTSASFLFSEYARARVLLDTLGASPEGVRPDAPPDLVREFDQLENDLHRSYTRQVANQLDETGLGQIQTLEARMAEVRALLRRYDRETLPYQSPPELSRIQQTLAPDAVILSYFAAGDELIVFVIDHSQVRQHCLPVRLTHIKARLNSDGQIRDITPDVHTERLSSHLGILQLLYDGLLKPIADWLVAYSTIYLVPDVELRHIPFHLLVPDLDRPRPLTEGNRHLMYLPSASLLTRLPALQTTPSARIVGYNGPNLMLMEAHAQRIAALTNGKLLIEAEATREAVMAAMNHCFQIYFAGHNLFRTPAPSDCGLLLAENRLLTLLDIQQLQLPGSRVILGACQSGLMAERGGDWLGLTSAFLQAGAAQVMGTLWPVSEIAVCLLMDRFWAALSSDQTNPLSALYQAQAEIRSLTLDDIRQAFAMYELSPQARDYVQGQLVALQNASLGAPHPLDHPYYWGPFILIGR